MTHHIIERLDAYLEGLLDPATVAELEFHTARCGSCRMALEAARDSQQCMAWLLPIEAPPEPGPDFYVRVEQSIEQRLARNWFYALAAAMHPRLAYPLVFLALLVAAWGLTNEGMVLEAEEALVVMEYPATEFAQMAVTGADREFGEDLVMMNLMELPEELF